MKDIYSIELELALQASDPNKILGRNKYAKNSVMKKAKKEIAILARGKTPLKPLKKFHITAIRHAPGYMDDDNFHAMLKPYIDGLKLSGIIINDSWKWLKPKDMTRDQVLSDTPKLFLKVKEIGPLEMIGDRLEKSKEEMVMRMFKQVFETVVIRD